MDKQIPTDTMTKEQQEEAFERILRELDDDPEFKAITDGIREAERLTAEDYATIVGPE